MKILFKGSTYVNTIRNNTAKTRNVVLRDGKDIVVAKMLLGPDTTYMLRMHFTHDIRISGENSESASFDGFNIYWEDKAVFGE